MLEDLRDRTQDFATEDVKLVPLQLRMNGAAERKEAPFRDDGCETDSSSPQPLIAPCFRGGAI